MLSRFNVIFDAALLRGNSSQQPWQNNFPDATVKVSLGYSLTFLGLYIVFGLLCVFVLFTLFFPTGGGFLTIFLLRDKSDGVGAFSTLSIETPLDIGKDESLTLSRQVLLLVELDEELPTISDSCDDPQSSL